MSAITPVGDLIADLKSKIAAERDKKDAYAAAQAATVAAGAGLRLGLQASGPVFVSDTTGVEVYMTDSSQVGWHSFRPIKAEMTPAPAPMPAPAPTPAPEPTPTPAPETKSAPEPTPTPMPKAKTKNKPASEPKPAPKPA